MRLHVPEAGEDSWCTKCDSPAQLGVRSSFLLGPASAGLNPEHARAGLLLPQLPDHTQPNRRRPADVYLPAWAGSPVAFDFAVTAPQRPETLAQACREAGASAAAYARCKEECLGTAATCAAQGIKFLPMIVETTGNWDVGAARVLKQLADAVTTRTGEAKEQLHALLLQELSVAVRSYRSCLLPMPGACVCR